MRDECSRLMEQRKKQYGSGYEEPAGQALLTSGYNLPTKYVIHTVGPIVMNHLTDNLCKELESCYRNILRCCVENGISTVAFCCISTGEFHFPNDAAARIAVQCVTKFLEKQERHFNRIIFNAFKDIDKKLYEKFLVNEHIIC